MSISIVKTLSGEVLVLDTKDEKEIKKKIADHLDVIPRHISLISSSKKEEYEDCEEYNYNYYYALVNLFDEKIPISKKINKSITRMLSNIVFYGEFLEKCININILSYAWEHWKDSGWIWSNSHPFIADKIIESIGYIDNHNHNEKNKEFIVKCLNSNSNDKVVDWLFKNPKYIRIKGLYKNSNKKVVMYCLDNFANDITDIIDLMHLYRKPYEESIEFVWNRIKTINRTQMYNLDRTVTHPHVEKLFLRDFSQEFKEYNDINIITSYPREIFRSQNPQIVDLILKYLTKNINQLIYNDAILENPNDRIVEFMLKKPSLFDHSDHNNINIFENPNDRIVNYIINKIETGDIIKSYLWRNSNEKAIEYSINNLKKYDISDISDSFLLYKTTPKLLRHILSYIKYDKENHNNVLNIIEKYSKFSDISIDLYDPDEDNEDNEDNENYR